MMKHASIIAALTALVFTSACGVHDTATPSLTGPSGFGLSIGLTASPDSINQDGGSQSRVTVAARDSKSNPIVGETFRLDVVVNGNQVDFGTLSARTLVTGADGTAAAVYTAPAASPAGSTVGTCGTLNQPGLVGQCVSIVATPVGGPSGANNPTDFTTAQSQSVLIRLMPVGLIVPTVQATPQFTVTPNSPAANAPSVFDASSSCAGPLNSSGACPAGSGSIVSYQWNFGDGATGTGAQVTHTFTTQQTFSVTLTITTDTGGTASTSKAITVGGSTTAPVATFVISPTAPAAGQTVLFNADASRAGAGHTLTQFNWNFGDPTAPDPTASGFQVTHAFQFPGSYTVVLTIADDAGQRTTTSQVVAVASGVVASLALSKTGGNSITADGSGSTPGPGSSITNYTFSYTDNGAKTTLSGVQSSRNITFSTSGTYTVTLTVTDSQNRVGTTQQSITVP